MEIIKLSDRLQAIASLVPNGAKVADIGTDHGYIPVWLAQQEIASKLTAADINKGPLAHARLTAAEYGVTDKISFQLCSGLEFDDSSFHDTIIIAGMGGELIASILGAAPWTKNGAKLILQPNSRIQVLVAWLIDNGYRIEDARLVKDAGKLYQILVVRGGDSAPIESEAERLVHRKYFEHHDPLLGEYLDSLIMRYQTAEKGMRMGKSESPDLNRTQMLIGALKTMKEEVMIWQL